MANVLFQIKNDVTERHIILNLIASELNSNKYETGFYAQPSNNIEEFIRINSTYTTPDIKINLGAKKKSNSNDSTLKKTLKELDQPPMVEFWYKIPFKLFKKIITHDFKTFNLKIGRELYYEVYNKEKVRYLSHRLLNNELNLGPNFIPKFNGVQPQRVYKRQSGKNYFIETGSNSYLRKEPQKFCFK
jgi:hypothetical protein